jgi:hypothetical protein
MIKAAAADAAAAPDHPAPALDDGWRVDPGWLDGNFRESGDAYPLTMTKKLLFAGAILLAVTLVAMAADAITGKWVYEQQGRGGGGGGGGTPTQVTLDLKADGAKLTGTVTMPAFGRGGGGGGGGTPPAPTPTEIKNGKVDGNNISFEVTREGRNGATTTKYEGSVSGSELKLKITRDTQNGPQTTEATAKKSTT